MRIIFIMTLISLLCLVSAKYLPDESTSRALLRNKRSSVDESSDTVENQSNECNGNEDDDDDDDESAELKKQEDTAKLQRKYVEKERKLQEKREKQERKIEEQVEKERKKQQKVAAKFEEEQRKLQEKLEKEKRKLEEKLAKEESKRAEKIAKEERKAQKEKSKQLAELEQKTLESANKPIDSSESGEDLDFDDIWKNYIYQKYGLTENSTDLDKNAAINSYLQQEIGLNANSTKAEYRQAVLQLVQSKLAGNSTTQSGFQDYFVSQVNAIIIQKLQADITNKIAELDNDTALLQNVTLPWAPQAKQAIGQEKSILTAIAQFLSDIVPTWITGGKPSSNGNTTSSSISNNDVLETVSTNSSSVSNNNEGSSSTSTSEAPNVQQVIVGDNIATESIDTSNPSIEGIPTDSNTLATTDNGSSLESGSLNSSSATSPVNVVPSDAGDLHVDSNVDVPAGSTNNLNVNSPVSQSGGSQYTENSSGSTAPGTTSPVIIEGSTDILPINGSVSNKPSVDATADNSQVVGTGPSEISNGAVTPSVLSPNMNNDASSTNGLLTISTDSQTAGSDILSLVSPSAESSTSINNISTGTEATTGSVTSNADVNTQVSNDNISGVNIGTHAVVEGSVSNSPSGSEASENTAAASTSDVVENEATAETVSSVVLPLAPGSDTSVIDQLSGANILETASVDSTSSITAVNDVNSIISEVPVTTESNTISIGEEATASVLPSSVSSISTASDATLSNVDVSVISQVTATTESETTVEYSVISADVSKPVNIATNPPSLTVDANIPEADPTVATSSDISIAGTSEAGTSDTVTPITTSSNTNTVNVGGPVLSVSTVTESVPAADVNSASDPISSVIVESTGISTAIPDVTDPSNVDKLVDVNPSDLATSGSSDSSTVISVSSSNITPVDSTIELSASNGNTITEETTANVAPASPEILTNTNDTVLTSSTVESITNASDMIVATTEVLVAAVNNNVTSIPETTAEAPTTGLEVANSISSNAIDTTHTNTEGTTNVNDSILLGNASMASENVSLGPSEVEASTTIPAQTSAPSAGTEAPITVTVASEPSNVDVSIVSEGLPTAIDTTQTNVVTNLIPSVDGTTGSNTVATATADVLEPVPVVVETPVSLAPIEVTTTVSDINVTPISSDGSAATSHNVELPAATSINDLSVSSDDITSAPESEAFGTDSGLSTTEQSTVAQNIITPVIPEEIGATLLEVTQQ